MNFYDVFVRSPVNRQAAQVFSSNSLEESLSNEEIAYLVARASRKRRYLEAKIGIKNKSQRKNLKKKVASNERNKRSSINPRAVNEWYRAGQSIFALEEELIKRGVPYEERRRLDIYYRNKVVIDRCPPQ